VPAPGKYPNELRERAVRLVAEAMVAEPDLSLNAAVIRIGPKVGIVPDTLRGWCKQQRVDTGLTPGTTTTDATKIKALEWEVKALKRANEIAISLARLSSRTSACNSRTVAAYTRTCRCWTASRARCPGPSG